MTTEKAIKANGSMARKYEDMRKTREIRGFFFAHAYMFRGAAPLSKMN
jgi:hypothetical protein